MILCSMMSVSWTVPITSPPLIFCPGLTFALKSYLASLSREFTSIPLEIKSPEISAILGNGLAIPSYMLFSKPGPSSMLSGTPIDSTGSLGFTPVVSS